MEKMYLMQCGNCKVLKSIPQCGFKMFSTIENRKIPGNQRNNLLSIQSRNICVHLSFPFLKLSQTYSLSTQGYDKFCVYKEVQCSNCSTTLGSIYYSSTVRNVVPLNMMLVKLDFIQLYDCSNKRYITNSEYDNLNSAKIDYIFNNLRRDIPQKIKFQKVCDCSQLPPDFLSDDTIIDQEIREQQELDKNISNLVSKSQHYIQKSDSILKFIQSKNSNLKTICFKTLSSCQRLKSKLKD